MTAIWVDTDFGFDDLWALLVLRRHKIAIAGISLCFGNAPLDRVVRNALGARAAYGFETPLFLGAARPRVRLLETAERILGPRGMRSRSRHLPDPAHIPDLPNAQGGLRAWLRTEQASVILAIGPLTNIAHLIQTEPEAARAITRIIWMGGSNGPGNHSAAAEFNALADPEAADIVARAGIPLDVIDLQVCRQVTFGPDDLPDMDTLTSDLLGGYLDIALKRGRPGMAIYDPVAACAAADLVAFSYQHMALKVCIEDGADYGATRFAPDPTSTIRLATACAPGTGALCLAALARKDAHAR